MPGKRRRAVSRSPEARDTLHAPNCDRPHTQPPDIMQIEAVRAGISSSVLLRRSWRAGACPGWPPARRCPASRPSTPAPGPAALWATFLTGLRPQVLLPLCLLLRSPAWATDKGFPSSNQAVCWPLLLGSVAGEQEADR